jgi:NAD+ kinase
MAVIVMSARDLVGFAYNPTAPKAESVVERLLDVLQLRDSSWVASTESLELAEETLARTRVLITAGGDGTILRAARVVAPYDVPILGINLGRVGFMTELSVDEAENSLSGYLDSPPRIESRMMLQASVATAGSREPHVVVHALNDVVLTRGRVAKLLDIDTRIDGVLLTTYRADGLIAATATGSTGYALSAGGTILHPEAREMLIQPVAAHMSFQTGIVVSEESVIELKVDGGHTAVLSSDGFSDTTVNPDDIVEVRRSPYTARFLRREPSEAFYGTLTQRLGVSGRQVPQPLGQ